MRTETRPAPSTANVLQQPPSLSETIEAGLSDCELPAKSCDPRAEHDPTLIVAALEHLEVQRAAIEWLLNADLLRLCLV